ncbi:MAG: hypothetical protein CM1200mP34_0270 [Verrucomicrobiales bacterium]|nr:MAG: hypothetical protein CM1200mP34_0270 [Verrucomicrobiales bacterium]
MLNQAVGPVETATGLTDSDGASAVMVFLEDHKAETLRRVVAAVKSFNKKKRGPTRHSSDWPVATPA